MKMLKYFFVNLWKNIVLSRVSSMKILSTLFVLFLFFLPKSYATSDSLRQVAFGVEVNYNVSVLPEKFSSGFNAQATANYLGVLGFAEFHLMERVRFSTGVGVARLSYSNFSSHKFNANLPQPDSMQHRNFHLASGEELLISSTVTCRFDYTLNPKIYVLLGLEPKYRIKSKESNIYRGTAIARDMIDGLVILSDPDPAPVFLKENFSIAGHIGAGIEIRNIAFEISFNKIASRLDLLNFWDFRLRYKI